MTLLVIFGGAAGAEAGPTYVVSSGDWRLDPVISSGAMRIDGYISSGDWRLDDYISSGPMRLESE